MNSKYLDISTYFMYVVLTYLLTTHKPGQQCKPLCVKKHFKLWFVFSFVFNHTCTLLAVDMAPAIFAVECMACVWCPMAITRELTFIFLAFCFRRFTSCLAKVVAALKQIKRVLKEWCHFCSWTRSRDASYLAFLMSLLIPKS